MRVYDLEFITADIMYNSIHMIMSKIKREEGNVAHMGQRRGAYRILLERPEGRRPLGRPRCRWEDNIKMDHQKVRWGWHGLG